MFSTSHEVTRGHMINKHGSLLSNKCMGGAEGMPLPPPGGGGGGGGGINEPLEGKGGGGGGGGGPLPASGGGGGGTLLEDRDGS